MTTGNYPTALTAPSQQDLQAVSVAIEWVRARLAPGQQALVWTPNAPALQEHPDLAAFAQAHTSMTRRTRHRVHWYGGPVLAGWPDTDALDDLANDRRVTALCVIPHGTLDEVAAWAARADAARLGTATALPVQGTLDPVVEQGLEALTVMVNHANNLAGAPGQATMPSTS